MTATSATRIGSAKDALIEAARLSAVFAEGAGARDADRRLPHDEIRALKESGLLAITVPVAHGGIDMPSTVLAEVIRLLSHGDSSIGQIGRAHV